jgi:hypothetical protein
MSVERYPKVGDEMSTAYLISQGASVARFGDGELKMATGHGYSREPPSRKMARELMDILTSPHPNCLVGIPTMDKAGPKYKSWKRHRDRFQTVLSPGVEYVSAFITRPDSAPWIRIPTFAQMIQRAWLGKKAVVLCEKNGSMLRTVQLTNSDAIWIECPHERAYRHISDYEKRIRELSPDVAIISAGPTATCLAHRLSKYGIQALDLGSAGKFLSETLAQDSP